MRYSDGQDAKIGDIVEIGDDLAGRVVMLVRERVAVEGFVADEWSYLNDGVLVETKTAGLIHYPDIHGHLLFLTARSRPSDLHE